MESLSPIWVDTVIAESSFLTFINTLYLLYAFNNLKVNRYKTHTQRNEQWYNIHNYYNLLVYYVYKKLLFLLHMYNITLTRRRGSCPDCAHLICNYIMYKYYVYMCVLLTRAHRRRVIVIGLCVCVCVSVCVLPHNLCEYLMILICWHMVEDAIYP